MQPRLLLACLTLVEGDLEVTIPPRLDLEGAKILKGVPGEEIARRIRPGSLEDQSSHS